MRMLTLAMLFILSPLLSFSQQMVSEIEQEKEADFYIILYYADWCHSCKKLSPKLDEVVDASGPGTIELVRFDYTDTNTKEKTKESAIQNNLSSFYTDFVATGYAILINKNREQLSLITSITPKEEIMEWINEHQSYE